MAAAFGRGARGSAAGRGVWLQHSEGVLGGVELGGAFGCSIRKGRSEECSWGGGVRSTAAREVYVVACAFPMVKYSVYTSAGRCGCGTLRRTRSCVPFLGTRLRCSSCLCTTIYFLLVRRNHQLVSYGSLNYFVTTIYFSLVCCNHQLVSCGSLKCFIWLAQLFRNNDLLFTGPLQPPASPAPRLPTAVCLCCRVSPTHVFVAARVLRWPSGSVLPDS